MLFLYEKEVFISILFKNKGECSEKILKYLSYEYYSTIMNNHRSMEVVDIYDAFIKY